MSGNIKRREFLSGLAAAGAVALVPDVLKAGQARPGGAAAATAGRRIIDTHYHYASPAMSEVLRPMGTGQTGLIEWNETKALDDMDKFGVATSMLSTSEPGVHFGDDGKARALARDMNDFGAKLVAKYPGRFGLFAVLPLPDVDGSLKEIAYAYDTLKADGISFMSSYPGFAKYQGNKYLGDPAFTPVMEELNRRRAICYTHPFRAEPLYSILPDRHAMGIVLATDTTVTIESILYTKTSIRFPNITFLWSHGGGTMPYITSRFGAGNPETMAEIQKFYYDTAQAYTPYTLAGLTKLIQNSHILFGSDYLGNAGSAGTVEKGLDAYSDLTPAQRNAIYRDNALALFPRFKQA